MLSHSVRKAVFPAAGLGTRFLPATKSLPKEMLALVDRPVIQYGVEEAVAAGITDIVIITSRGKSTIEDHFDSSFELESLLASRGKTADLAEVRRIASLARIAYVRQQEALGLGHAVSIARPLVGSEPFAVFLPDDIIVSEVPCIQQMLDIHARTGASVVALEAVARERVSSYGIIAGEKISEGLWKISDLVEKPQPDVAPSNLGVVGRYILTPRIFDRIADSAAGALGEIQLTDALRGLLRDEPIYGCEFSGRRYDAGNKLGFLQATVEMALGHAVLGKPFGEWLRSLKP